MGAFSRAARLGGLSVLQGLPTSLGGIAAFQGLTSGLSVKGGVNVSVTSPNADAVIRRLIQLGAVTMHQADYAIAAETTAAVRRIQSRWPVDTGFSRARWRRMKLAPARYAIVNDAGYAGYVHRKGQTAPLVDSLVPAEIEVARVRIRARLQVAMRRALGRSASLPATL